MTRRDFGLNAAGAAFLQGAQARKRPNILFVVSDDHSAQHLGCYGDPVIRTPRLDAFAKEGMRFERAYTTAPQCSPSRASMMTGQAPARVNMTRLHSPLPPEHKTFFEYLREAGYYTGIAGRTHHMDGHLVARPWFNRFYEKNGLQTMPKRADVVHSGSQEQGLDVFARFLKERPKDKPFAMQVNLTDPHWPWTAKEEEKLYRPEDIPLPKHYPDTPELRQRLLTYYAEVTRADRDFGRAINTLRSEGLQDDTLVVFMGDNGYSFPFGKVTLYQAGWHVPLLMRWPGRIGKGSVQKALVSGSDLFSTFLDVAGVEAPRAVEGRSIRPLWEGAASTRKYAFSTRGWHDRFDLGRAVCTSTHSFIYNVWPEYKAPGWPAEANAEKDIASGRLDARAVPKWNAKSRPLYELYDLHNDPLELTNLAGRAEMETVQRELMEAMTEWMEVSRDFVPPPFLNSTKLDADPLHVAAPRPASAH